MAYHIRSISMPSTSHSPSLRVEEELHKLSTHLATSSKTSQMLMNGLRGAGDLYECIDELLRLHSSSRSLRTRQNKLVDEQLDFSLRLLDLVTAVRDSMATMREHVQDLQSAIRRKGNICADSRKKAQKMFKDCLKSFKQLSGNPIDNNTDQLTKGLVEARGIIISLLRSVLSFVSMPKTKSSRWSIVSKAISKRKVACEDAREEESVAMCLQSSYDCILCKDADALRVQKAHDDLQALDSRIEGLETGLVFLFRQLIQNRVTLLNILSL